MSIKGFKVNNQTEKYDYEALDNLPDAAYTAPGFDQIKPYAEGVYVTYGGKLYRFNVDHPSGQAWSGTDVTEVPLGAELLRLASSDAAIDLVPLVNSNGVSLANSDGSYTLNGITYKHHGSSGARNGQYSIMPGTGGSSTSFYTIINTPVSDSDLIHRNDTLCLWLDLVEGSLEDFNKVYVGVFSMNNGSVVKNHHSSHRNRYYINLSTVSGSVDKLLIRLQVPANTTFSSKVTIRLRLYNESSGSPSGFLTQHSCDFPFDDLDKATPGIWLISTGETPAHSPYLRENPGLNPGLLIHQQIANVVHQIYIPTFINNRRSSTIFTRSWLQDDTDPDSLNKTWMSVGNGGYFLESITDLNQLTQSGIYGLDEGTSYQNSPLASGSTGILFCYRIGDWIWQTCFNWSGTSMWSRHANSNSLDSSWSSWNSISGGSPNTYTFNNYNNTYTVSSSPTITTSTNNYLASTGNTTDRTADIVSMLSQTGVCNLGPGDFYVNNLQMPDDTTIRGSGKATRVILSGSSAGYAIKMGRYCTVEDVSILGSASSISTSGLQTIGDRHGIMWQGNYTESSSNAQQPWAGMISNVRIFWFTGGGITCSDTGYSIFCHLTVNNVYIESCGAGINIAYWSEFHKFTNVRTYGCYYGCINNGGNNVFVNCDFSGCKLAFLMDNENGQSPNNSHGSAIGCVFNHTDSNNGIGIKILNCDSGFVFDGCQIFFSQIYIVDSDGVIVSNSNFGNTNCNITVSGGGVVLFNGNMHQAAPVITVTNNNNVHFVNCYVRNTGAVVA